MYAYMHEKEEKKGKKCYLKVVVGLGQALLPNLNNVVLCGTHF